MSEYFPKPISFGGRLEFELNLSNYATKFRTNENANKMIDLASLKSEVDKLDIDELEKVPTIKMYQNTGILYSIFLTLALYLFYFSAKSSISS